MLPHLLSYALTAYYKPSIQQYQLAKSFSLLLLGMFLSSLATLNFSLALLVGLFASPLTYARPWPRWPVVRHLVSTLLAAVAPNAVLVAGAVYWRIDVSTILREAAFGWDVWGMYTAVVVWCVWWPAWLVGSVIVLGKPEAKAKMA